MTTNPATEVRDYIITALKAALPDMEPDAIRAKLDVNSDAPRGDAAIIVSTSDEGGHGGLPGRILVDIGVNIIILTHLDEDTYGTLAGNLSSVVMETMSSIRRGTALTGWTIRFEGIWQQQEPQMTETAFRETILSSTMFLQVI